MIYALVVVVAVLVWAVWTFNRLVGGKLGSRNALQQIDVQLKRRHDLIPNLVETVKGTMKFEQETLAKVIEARGKAMAATTVGEKAQAEGVLGQALGKLIALSENYPQLKSNENARQLMEELSHTENTIGFARQNYNDQATRYNMLRTMFPSSVVAGMGSFPEAELWKVEGAEDRATPKVDLKLS